MKHTHRGHCQCCGRLQAVKGSKIAKHGYKVIGYFHGTCSGSGRSALELDREYTDACIASALDDAKGCDDSAVMHTDGRAKPLQCESGVYVRETDSRGVKRRVSELIPWADATDLQRSAYILKIVAQLNARAKFMRGYAKDLGSMADQINGRALVAVGPAKPAITVGCTVRVHGRERVVSRIGEAVCRGVGPGLNGKYAVHCYWKDVTGLEVGYPLRFCKFIKSKEETTTTGNAN